MNVTALLGLVLGLVVAPTMVARAWVAAPQKAAMFGLLGAGALVIGIGLFLFALWTEKRWNA